MSTNNQPIMAQTKQEVKDEQQAILNVDQNTVQALRSLWVNFNQLTQKLQRQNKTQPVLQIIRATELT